MALWYYTFCKRYLYFIATFFDERDRSGEEGGGGLEEGDLKHFYDEREGSGVYIQINSNSLLLKKEHNFIYCTSTI